MKFEIIFLCKVKIAMTTICGTCVYKMPSGAFHRWLSMTGYNVKGVKVYKQVDGSQFFMAYVEGGGVKEKDVYLGGSTKWFETTFYDEERWSELSLKKPLNVDIYGEDKKSLKSLPDVSWAVKGRK